MLTEVKLDKDQEPYIIISPPRYKYNENGEPEIIKLWIPLVLTLWNKITNEQKQNIVCIRSYDGVKIINFMSLINCYEYSYYMNATYCWNYHFAYLKGSTELKDYNYFGKIGHCSCGVPIKNKFIIFNKITKNKYIIGCDCIQWWKAPPIQVQLLLNLKKNIENKLNENELMPEHCEFCFRKRCRNCKVKSIISKHVKNWINYIKMVIQKRKIIKRNRELAKRKVELEKERRKIESERLKQEYERKIELENERIRIEAENLKIETEKQETLKIVQPIINKLKTMLNDNKDKPEQLRSILDELKTDDFLSPKKKQYYNFIYSQLSNEFKEFNDIVYKWEHETKIYFDIFNKRNDGIKFDWVERKNEAKMYGARYDGELKKWYCYVNNKIMPKKYPRINIKN
jgi:hypothetical protein